MLSLRGLEIELTVGLQKEKSYEQVLDHWKTWLGNRYRVVPSVLLSKRSNDTIIIKTTPVAPLMESQEALWKLLDDVTYLEKQADTFLFNPEEEYLIAFKIKDRYVRIDDLSKAVVHMIESLDNEGSILK